MTKPNTGYPRSEESSKVGIGKNSHVISKSKPKVKITHVRDPEIIKTDPANFKEVVQRLTGKPEDEGSKTALTKDPMHGEDKFQSLQNGTEVKKEHEEKEVEDDDMLRSNEKFSDLLDEFPELGGFMEDLSAVLSEDEE